ncbi:alpha/beta hydrolase [Terrilactibacillus sp. S3-3]|nr:alpha/beta hydrolase [Terrilactibacillus sp. S3-3]
MSKLHMDGYDLHYTVYGLIDKNQPTLLFIHTIGFDATEWNRLLPNINPSFNLVTYDFYGHGKTSAPNGDLSFEKLEWEMIALIKKLGTGKVHLVGSSFGGNLGFFVAKRHPELVDSLTLMSAAFYIPRNSYNAEYKTKVQLMDIDQELLSQKIVMDSVYPVTPEKAKLIKKAFRRVSGELYKKGMAILMSSYSWETYNMMDELKQLNVPALILHGEFDPIFPAHLCIVYSTCISNSRWFIIPEASSLIALDQPKIVANFLNDFIASEKIPVPVTRSHQKMIDEFKTIIEKGYQYKPTYRHFLKMTIMGIYPDFMERQAD